jgi:hypothetical protein
MKRLLSQMNRLSQIIPLALASFSLSFAAQAAPWDYPTGNTWDCITSGGGQDGITILTFGTETNLNGLYTFSGYFVHAGKKGGGGTDARGGSTGDRTENSGSSNSVMNLFGAGNIGGSWYFDSNGRIVGSYYTVVNVTGLQTNYSATNVLVFVDAGNGDTTNVVVAFTNEPTTTITLTWQSPTPYTNDFTFDNPNFTLSAHGTTNSVSFVGKVLPGKRLTMVASTVFGKVAFKGVPQSQTLFLDGSMWTATKTKAGLNYQDFFHLTQTATPNVYLVDGEGPAYTYSSLDTGIGTQSFCLVSCQKKMGFYIAEFPIGSMQPLARTTFGKLSTGTIGTKFQTKGAGEPDLDVPLTFNGSMVPPL